MPIFVIAVVIVVVTLISGIFIAFGAARMDTAVKDAQASIANKNRGFNPAVTFGHRITVDTEVTVQLKEARIIAAKRAAALPRGANMGIGRLGEENLQTAGRRLEDDPVTAVRIAAFHDWDGARTGAVASAPVSSAAPAAVPAPSGKIQLTPGKDYPVIEISDDMPPDEKRKARIANVKAKSAAMKAAKEAQKAVAETVVAPAVAAPAAPSAATPPVVSVDMPQPPELVEITEAMTPEEKRTARIANSKAKSAYNRAVKAAGLDPKAAASGTVSAASAAVAPATAPAPVTEAVAASQSSGPAADLTDIPKPDFIDISDDMPPDEKRKARIHNAKARSAYNKALKAAGIDPKTVST
jgi:hypothetical protein